MISHDQQMLWKVVLFIVGRGGRMLDIEVDRCPNYNIFILRGK
jgi:hypothetical protein